MRLDLVAKCAELEFRELFAKTRSLRLLLSQALARVQHRPHGEDRAVKNEICEQAIFELVNPCRFEG